MSNSPETLSPAALTVRFFKGNPSARARYSARQSTSHPQFAGAQGVLCHSCPPNIAVHLPAHPAPDRLRQTRRKGRIGRHDQPTFGVAEGRLDFNAAADFQAQIEQALAAAGKAPAALLIDCAGLEYISSAGLRVFLLAARSSQRSGLSFAVCSLHQPVREVFDLSGFSRVMTVQPDRATALAQLPASPA